MVGLEFPVSSGLAWGGGGRPRCCQVLELAPNDVKTEDLETQFLEETDVEQWGAELYNVLCSLTAGEALTIVRGETGMNGFTA